MIGKHVTIIAYY